MTVSMTLPQAHRHECTVDGRCVHLPPAAAKVLEVLLVSHPDRFVPRDQLFAALWPDPDREPDEASKCIDVYLWRLRHLGVPIENCFARQAAVGFGGWRIPRHARAGAMRLGLAA